MEHSPKREPSQSATIRKTPHISANEKYSTPESGLKGVAGSLKDSTLAYLGAKAELTAIETKEAADFAQQRLKLGMTTAFFAIFSYALFLILLHGIILQHAENFITRLSQILTLNESSTVILLLLIANVFIFIVYLLKLSKKPQEELFALTKSEFKKDKQWLAEINQTQEK